jgi:hypothetical protein
MPLTELAEVQRQAERSMADRHGERDERHRGGAEHEPGERHDERKRGEVERYEDICRLCYVRGPEGIIVELAERLG